MKTIQEQGYTIKIGQNATENWKLLSMSDKNDYIFHLAHYPSPYVILTSETPETETFIRAAQECKANTKQRNISSLAVDYSLCSNVEKGDKLGEMIWKSNRKVKTVFV